MGMTLCCPLSWLLSLSVDGVHHRETVSLLRVWILFVDHGGTISYHCPLRGSSESRQDDLLVLRVVDHGHLFLC